MDVDSDDANDKNHASTKKRHLPVTPHPPSSIKPQPPSKHMKRPYTAGDFCSKRYRQRFIEEPIQFVDTYHYTDNDGGKLELRLDSRQPDHLTDINGQYQNVHCLEDTTKSIVEPSEKKPPKKLVIKSI